MPDEDSCRTQDSLQTAIETRPVPTESAEVEERPVVRSRTAGGADDTLPEPWDGSDAVWP